MKWREKWEVDSLEDWTPPTVCEDYCPHGTTGFDKEGSVVIVVPFSGIDIWGLLHSTSKHDIIKNTVRTLESESLKLKFYSKIVIIHNEQDI